MNKERIQFWIDALRSGNYKQAKGALRTNDGFCCLGVGCDISKVAHWDIKDGGRFSYDNIKGVLSWSVQYYFDVDRSEGLNLFDVFGDLLFLGGDFSYSLYLTNLNDEHDFTFPMIADILQYWIDNAS